MNPLNVPFLDFTGKLMYRNLSSLTKHKDSNPKDKAVLVPLLAFFAGKAPSPLIEAALSASRRPFRPRLIHATEPEVILLIPFARRSSAGRFEAVDKVFESWKDDEFVSPELLNAWQRVSTKMAAPPMEGYPGHVRVLAKTAAHYIISALDWWGLYQRFPNAVGMLEVSPIAYSAADTEAIVYGKFECDMHGAWGVAFFLEEVGQNWRVKRAEVAHS